MTLAAGLFQQVWMGIALGLQFHPVTALAGAAVASVAVGYPKAPEARRPIAVAILTLAWLAGDGARIGRSIAAGTPTTWQQWLPVALWIVVGFIVGYVVPAAAGALAGRRVVRGTGWLTAGAVSLMVGGAIAALAPSLAEAVVGLAAAGGG